MFTKLSQYKNAILWFLSLKSDVAPFSKCLVKTFLAELMIIAGCDSLNHSRPSGGRVNEWERTQALELDVLDLGHPCLSFLCVSGPVM